MDTNEIDVLTLAYIGDAVYEVEVRNYLLKKSIKSVNDMQKEAVKYVSANSQEIILDNLIERNILSDNELYVIKNARNHKIKSKPRHVSVKTYKKATAIETLFGFLYLKNDFSRIKEIMKEILGE